MTEKSTIRIPTAQEWGDRILGSSNTLRMLVNDHLTVLRCTNSAFPASYTIMREKSVEFMEALVRSALAEELADKILDNLTKNIPVETRQQVRTSLESNLNKSIRPFAEHLIDKTIERQPGRTI